MEIVRKKGGQGWLELALVSGQWQLQSPLTQSEIEQHNTEAQKTAQKIARKQLKIPKRVGMRA